MVSSETFGVALRGLSLTSTFTITKQSTTFGKPLRAIISTVQDLFLVTPSKNAALMEKQDPKPVACACNAGEEIKNKFLALLKFNFAKPLFYQNKLLEMRKKSIMGRLLKMICKFVSGMRI